MPRSVESPVPFPARVPFVDALGITLHSYGEGQAELRLDLDAAHLNTWDVAHGGVLMTMLDVAMAMSARSAHANGQGVATIEMKTSFMRPAQHQLRCLGRVLHQTATLAFCEAQVLDDAGHACATATGTFKYLRGLKPRARPAHADTTATPNTPAEDTP